MDNFPKTFSEAFEKLDDETKEAMLKILHSNGGPPTFFKALKEFMNVDNPDAERNVYLASILAFMFTTMKENQEEDGKIHHYEVALCCGGVMEDPDIHYENHQIIEARSRAEAKEIYDKRNNCSYYYGEVLRQID